MKNNFQIFLACACLALLLANCNLNSPKPTTDVPAVPDTLKVASTEVYAFKLKAEGYQTYKCEGNKWVRQAPSAHLFDEHNTEIGLHFGGPSWQAKLRANDTSKVVGTVKISIPSSSKGAIDWVLLDGKGEGKGMFARVTKIQRLETNGGKSPEGGCDSLCNGVVIKVPYTATYYFYTANK